MDNFESEEEINKVLTADNQQRKFVPIPESRWGELIIPAKNENPDKTNEGFRVVVFASYLLGYMLLETLKECERRYPSKLNITALITDDPANPGAKISLKKRIWRLYDSEEKLSIEKAIVESALSFGIPCYTGEVKIEHFGRLLKIWNPDAILVCVFGQIIDAPVINFPAFGIYNFHPSDLADRFGAGPQPFEDLIARKADTTKVTIHQLTEKIDSGPIVAQSTPIKVKMENGEMPDNVLVIDDKIIPAIDHMAAALISELISRKERNEKGVIQKINLEEIFPESYKTKLMEPIRTNVPSEILPSPDKNLVFSI
jgi:folate-dependent phosphoribosylglycinamide formyltransferase PurN